MWFFCLAKIGTGLSQKWEISYKIVPCFVLFFVFAFDFFWGLIILIDNCETSRLRGVQKWFWSRRPFLNDERTKEDNSCAPVINWFNSNWLNLNNRNIVWLVLSNNQPHQNHFCTPLRRDVSQLSINASFFKLPLTEANVKFELLKFC
jgi:hypothetical protein